MSQAMFSPGCNTLRLDRLALQPIHQPFDQLLSPDHQMPHLVLFRAPQLALHDRYVVGKRPRRRSFWYLRRAGIARSRNRLEGLITEISFPVGVWNGWCSVPWGCCKSSDVKLWRVRGAG